EDLDRFETTRPHKTGQNIVGVALIIDHQNGARHGQDPKSLREFHGFLNLTTRSRMALPIVSRRAVPDKALHQVASRLLGTSMLGNTHVALRLVESIPKKTPILRHFRLEGLGLPDYPLARRQVEKCTD